MQYDCATLHKNPCIEIKLLYDEEKLKKVRKF